MSYKIYYTNPALKKLTKVQKKNKKDYKIIKDNIEKLELNPHNPKNIYLKSYKCPRCRRMTSGDYRIVYYIHTKEKIVEIVRIIDRNKDYREF